VLRVTLRGSGVPTVTVGSGDTLLFGRSPHGSMPVDQPEAQLRHHAVALPGAAAHVSRLVGELAIGDDVVRLRWRGATEAQLSSLFDAPGGARRVTLAPGMSALLDDGENHILILRGRATGDIQLSVQVDEVTPVADDGGPGARASEEPDGEPTGPAPRLARLGKEWYVALALCEPWLSGADDYPRPPSNREVYERVLGWRGYAWNLVRPQRVDDALRVIARIAFGPRDDPFAASAAGRVQNVRYAIGRRAAEVRLVTIEDLEEIEREARRRARG